MTGINGLVSTKAQSRTHSIAPTARIASYSWRKPLTAQKDTGVVYTVLPNPNLLLFTIPESCSDGNESRNYAVVLPKLLFFDLNTSFMS
jgi:hypothetical protein